MESKVETPKWIVDFEDNLTPYILPYTPISVHITNRLIRPMMSEEDDINTESPINQSEGKNSTLIFTPLYTLLYIQYCSH